MAAGDRIAKYRVQGRATGEVNEIKEGSSDIQCISINLEERVGMFDPGAVDEWGSDQEHELATSQGGTAGLSRGELAKVRNREVCFALRTSNSM